MAILAIKLCLIALCLALIVYLRGEGGTQSGALDLDNPARADFATSRIHAA
ncbi:MAG: hypothetical protein AAF311_12315 [Pseudomonadota bacterium]